jgi:thioredoxin-like negative regulator of GroEL
MIKLLIVMIALICANNTYGSEQAFVSSLEDAIALSEDTKMPILLVFGADWCKNCVSLKQDMIKGDLLVVLDGFIICYVNIDDNQELPKLYKVKNIPDSRIISGGIETKPLVGYNKTNYKKWLMNRGQ